MIDFAPSIIVLIFILLFFAHAAASVLFWVYLWQLKEYHTGRFLDHFRTEKGRRIFLNWKFGVKFAFLAAFAAPFFVSLSGVLDDTVSAESGYLSQTFLYGMLACLLFLMVLYVMEGLRVIRRAYKRTLLVPKRTLKTILLSGVSFLASAGILVFLLRPSEWAHVWESVDLFGVVAFRFWGLLLYDIVLLPLVVSGIVLAFQPFAAIAKRGVLKRATRKRASLKKLKVVGITGSYGKTTTKEFLAHILSKKFWTVKTPEHKNSEMGIAQTILQDLTDEHEVFVCEMGAYNKGGIALLSDMAKPDIGIVAGVNDQHLALFGSLANLASAEGGGELAGAIPPHGVMILNYDSPRLRELGQWLSLWNPNLSRVVWCSAKEQKDVWAGEAVVEKDKVRFVLHDEGGSVKTEVPAFGGHAIENILLATAVARELGMSLEEIAEALKDAPAEACAMRLEQGKKGIDIIDSSYSANPDGVLAALEHIKLWQGRKIVVMPCLLELGKASKQAHEEIGRKIGQVCDEAIITSKDCFSDLEKGAKEGGMKEGSMIFLESSKSIAREILQIAKKGDVVLLEGRVPAGLKFALLAE